MFFWRHSKKSEELMIGIMDPATRLDFTASGCFKWKATTNLGEFLTLSSDSHVASSTGYPLHHIITTLGTACLIAALLLCILRRFRRSLAADVERALWGEAERFDVP